MKNLTLVIGLSSVVALTLWACSDDVETSNGPTSSSSSTGGTGGTGGTPVTTATTTSSTGGNGTGGFANVCEEACNHVEVDCGLTGACAAAASQLMVDLVSCSDMVATCSADCLVDADCQAIFSLAGSSPDPELIGCVSACQDDCFGCVFGSCGPEIQACNAEPACQGFIQCFQACPVGDSACYNNCAASNPSTETTNLLNCAGTNCSTDCQLGGGGAGGAGGGGGTGGGGGGN